MTSKSNKEKKPAPAKKPAAKKVAGFDWSSITPNPINGSSVTINRVKYGVHKLSMSEFNRHISDMMGENSEAEQIVTVQRFLMVGKKFAFSCTKEVDDKFFVDETLIAYRKIVEANRFEKVFEIILREKKASKN